MKKIVLLCCAGMSTSLLVTKMQEAATKQDLKLTIVAVSEAEARSQMIDADVVLLGPQVRYLLGKISGQLKPKGAPVGVIDSVSYGTINGEAVVKQALGMLKEPV